MPRFFNLAVATSIVSVLVASPLSVMTPSAYASETFNSATVGKDPALAARLPKDIAASGILVVGSDTSYPPAEFLGGSDGQTPEGIDVDIAAAIARTLGLKTPILDGRVRRYLACDRSPL